MKNIPKKYKLSSCFLQSASFLSWPFRAGAGKLFGSGAALTFKIWQTGRASTKCIHIKHEHIRALQCQYSFTSNGNSAVDHRSLPGHTSLVLVLLWQFSEQISDVLRIAGVGVHHTKSLFTHIRSSIVLLLVTSPLERCQIGDQSVTTASPVAPLQVLLWREMTAAEVTCQFFQNQRTDF